MPSLTIKNPWAVPYSVSIVDAASLGLSLTPGGAQATYPVVSSSDIVFYTSRTGSVTVSIQVAGTEIASKEAQPVSLTVSGDTVYASPLDRQDILDALASSRYESEVSWIVEAAQTGFVPVGIDATNNIVYGTGDASSSTLSKCSDSELKTWIPLYDFGSTHTLNLVTVTAAGAILAHTTTASAGFIYRSTNGGLTFTQVLTGTYLGCTHRSHCQTTNGNLYIGEYTTATGTYTLKLYKSTDDGQNWTAVQTWTDTGDGTSNRFRHVHFVRADPYVANRIWIGVGDGALLSTQSNIGYSDDAGATITWLSNVAGQDYRSVDLLFTSDALWWGMDAPSQAQKLYRYDRNTGALTTFVDDAVGSLYYGVTDGNGLGLYITTYETGTNQTDNTRIFTGRLTSTAAKWKDVFVHPAIPSALSSTMYPFGPLADGSIVIGVRHTKSGELVQTIYRGKLVSGKTWQHGPIQPTKRSKLRNAATGLVLAGPPPAAFGANYVTAGAVNRIYFGRCSPTRDIQVKTLTYAVGGTSAGNVTAGLWECDDTGQPTTLLAKSASTAQGSINTAQSLTFDRPVFLSRDREYFASLQFDTATATFLGMDTKITLDACQKYSDSVAYPAPNPLGVTASATVRQACMVLVAGL